VPAVAFKEGVMPKGPASQECGTSPADRTRVGCVHVYTGEGKGKTTAAMGLALRSVGYGRRVFIGQFLKAGVGGELTALARHDGVDVEHYGRGRFIVSEPDETDRRGARGGISSALEALAGGRYDLVILDEIDVALACGLVTLDDCHRLLDARPDHVELVFTGRAAPPEMIERADLVTEMREVKHYFRRGVRAREGIEY
jgi:cob(I)alamin adenosyltransferase